MKPRLLLLGRPGCGLCEEFEAELLAHFGADRFELEHVDVDGHAVWRTRYGLRIPVLLTAQGELLCATRFDAAELEPLLGAAS
ncbi:MAG TPA: glutaredoxin family protein [Stenotrophobium sp.]|nr:glutaredoxin family protein [Stenotrophobium sp.]